MPFSILALVRSHKGIELHFGRRRFSDGHRRGRICVSNKVLDATAAAGPEHLSCRPGDTSDLGHTRKVIYLPVPQFVHLQTWE